MLAVHPHRETDQATPQVTAVLRTPGWEAKFRYTLELEACTLRERWPGPATCLAADLPERIIPGQKYTIRGEAPLGPFTGETTVPEVPLLLEPPANLRVVVRNLLVPVDIPMRFHTGPDIGTLLVDIEGGVEGNFPQPVEGTEADTVTIIPRGGARTISLHLLGIGLHYTNFLAKVGLTPVQRPWPSFGIEGEGTYGYFDGVTPSRVSEITLERG